MLFMCWVRFNAKEFNRVSTDEWIQYCERKQADQAAAQVKARQTLVSASATDNASCVKWLCACWPGEAIMRVQVLMQAHAGLASPGRTGRASLEQQHSAGCCAEVQAAHQPRESQAAKHLTLVFYQCLREQASHCSL
jgi:hypothetical protein